MDTKSEDFKSWSAILAIQLELVKFHGCYCPSSIEDETAPHSDRCKGVRRVLDEYYEFLRREREGDWPPRGDKGDEQC